MALPFAGARMDKPDHRQHGKNARDRYQVWPGENRIGQGKQALIETE